MGSKMEPHIVFCFLFALLFSSTSGSPPLQLSQFLEPEPLETQNGPFATVRLPGSVVPLHYDLVIRPIVTPDPEQFKAPGEVRIRVRCEFPTSNITLHAADLDILHDQITVMDGSVPINVTGHSNDTGLSFYIIQLASNLIAGREYDVFIPFVANVADRLDGLYRSHYNDSNGDARWLATTQFQKLGARTAFPCFDEPQARATFNITVGRPSTDGYHSLSNSALRETVPIPGMTGWVWDIYERTVSMPPYLIAIIVSDFEFVDAPAGISNYTVKTWGPPPMTDNSTGEFSARAAAQILEFFEAYFDSPYQFPKLDSVAVPQFAAGAMENWALNTYRLVLMLWFEGESTQFEQWRQAAVIAHEITHHWFGNLVTCDWWNDLWLNEGFARYMQFIGANASLTEHGIMDRYTIDVIQIAMDYDAGPNSRPVRENDTETVGNQPARIIYEKAAALIRMMQSFLSEETLIKGLRVYLDKYEYQNTVQDQLFAELQAQQAVADGIALEYPVKEIMDSWTLKTRFPIITVRRMGLSVVSFSQEPFVSPEERTNNPWADELWYVPINIASKSNPDFTPTNWKPQFWMDKYTLGTSKIMDTEYWIVVNADARNFYRVVYDDHFFTKIVDQLGVRHTDFSLSTRSQLIDDYFKSVGFGYTRIEDAFNLTKYLHLEMENTVWTTVTNNLRPINRLLHDNAATYAEFKAYILTKVEPVLEEIGWDQNKTDDKPVTIILRAQLLDWACAFGSPKCIELTEKYLEELSSGGSIPADIQPMVYCKAVSTFTQGDPFDIIDHVMNKYKVANRVETTTLFLNALACQDPSRIENFLESILNGADIKNEDGVQLIRKIAENPDNHEHVRFMFTLFTQTILSKFGSGGVRDILTTLVDYTAGAGDAVELDGLIDRLNGQVDDSVKPSLAALKTQLARNEAWLTANNGRIHAWLLEQKSP